MNSSRTHLARIIALSALLLAVQPALLSQSVPQTDFGPNVKIFTPAMDPHQMQAQIDTIYAQQQHSEFGSGRYAIVFMPGTYRLDVPVGFYTEVIGLGSTPDAVRIEGNVHSDAASRSDNATTTFWRGIEGLSVLPTGGTMQWAVSQAAPARRMHVLGNVLLNQRHGWSSGGWLSDSLIDGTVNSGTQQQWISRNCEWAQWTGSNWNMVFVGVSHPPDGEWPNPPYTKIPTAPITREKPFLQVDPHGRFSVRVPGIAKASSGVTWKRGSTPGRSIPISQFYIAHPEKDNELSINAALSRGKHLLLLPGIYDLHAPIRITRPGTVVLGLGFATLRPVAGTEAMTVADLDGVTVSGLLFDAGPVVSPSLLHIGERETTARHLRNPTTLHDVFFRVGGASEGRTDANLIIDSNDVIVDHTWIWRADHGKSVGWNQNQSNSGIVVRGSDVTTYGLFVEHHQQYQVLWTGERGRTYMYQSEIPYDPPTQAAWSAEGEKGYPSYKVGSAVKQHEAWGLGIYSVFIHPDVTLDRAIEVPDTPGVRFHHMITVALGTRGAISNVINQTGGPTRMNPRFEPKVTDYPNP